jgi:hypothetical protein
MVFEGIVIMTKALLCVKDLLHYHLMSTTLTFENGYIYLTIEVDTSEKYHIKRDKQIGTSQ